MARFQPPGRPNRPGSQPTEDEDVFLARILILTAWARKNSQALIVGGVVLAAAIVGTMYYLGSRGEGRQQAILQLEEIQQSVEMGERAGIPERLEGFLAQHRGTAAAHEARMLLGELHLEEGRVNEAIVVLEPALRNLRHPVAIQAGALLGVAYELADRPQDAENAYLQVGRATRMNFQLREALGSAARLRADRGDLAGAATLYREILETFSEEDPDRGLYLMRLSEIEVRQARN